MTKFAKDRLVPVTGEPLPPEVRAEISRVHRANGLDRFPAVTVDAWNLTDDLPLLSSDGDRRNVWKVSVGVDGTEWNRTAEVWTV